MLRTIFLSVLFVATISAVSVTNTYGPAVVTGQITYGPPLIAPPVYPLSAVDGDVLTIYLNFPFPLSNLNPTSISVAPLNAAAGALVTQNPANNAQQNVLTYTVSGGPVVYIAVYYDSPDVNIYELDVRVNGVSKLKVADMVRSQPRSYYYLASELTTTYTVSVTQATSSTGSPAVDNTPLSGKFIAGTTVNQVGSLAAATTYSVSFVNLTSGYYYLEPSWITPDLTATVTYSTDFYICPFDSSYIDYYGTFRGCSFGNIHQAYVIQAHGCGIRQYFLNGTCINVDSSCNTFDPLSGACFTCFDNSRTAVRGVCVNASTAPVNPPVCADGFKVFNNATCIPIECSAVLANGACSACVNSAFVLTLGNCIPVNCGTGFYFSVALNQCVTLPARCVIFNLVTQLCRTCTNGFFPNSAGVCVSPCPTGQFFINQQCYTLPANCLNLTNVLHCDACATNYRLIQGECRLCNGPNPSFPCTTCPLNQFVNTNGQCVSIASNCASIDQVTGRCLSCANGLTPVNGLCCPAGQTIQADGSCSSSSSSNGGNSNVDFNVHYKYCKIFNSVRQQCQQCLNGRTFAGSTDRCQ